MVVKMNNPLISVIVPVYNVEKYLPRCIDSIIDQTFKNFELLLIDDGSKDKSGEICDEYAKRDNRIKVFHKENGGVSSARNVGLDSAKGEWISFCDSDDYVYPSWLECFVKNLSLSPDLVITGFISQTIENNKQYKYIKANIFTVQDVITELLEADILGYLWCKCFNKKIIKLSGIKFNERYIIWEDVLFIYQYLCCCHKVVSDSSINYYYFQPDFNAKYKGINNFDCCYQILQCIANIYDFKKSYAYEKMLSILFSFLLDYYKKEEYDNAFLKLPLYKNLLRKIGLVPNHRFANFIIFFINYKIVHILLMIYYIIRKRIHTF